MIICKIDCHPDLFGSLVRCLYPFDEYHCHAIKWEWSWRHFGRVPTAYLKKRTMPLSEQRAQTVILCLKAGKSVMIAKEDDDAMKIVQRVFDHFHPNILEVSIDHYSILIKL